METISWFLGWNSKQNVECKATYNGEITYENPAYKDNDKGYSNQGPGSTCTRQAIAKATKFKLDD